MSTARMKQLERGTAKAAKSKGPGMATPAGPENIDNAVQMTAQLLTFLAFKYLANAKEKDDLRLLRAQIAGAMPASGGVLVIRFVGERTDPWGSVTYEYIGLRVGPSAPTSWEAILKYEQQKQAAEEKPSGKPASMCFPEDLIPKSPSAGATMSAAPKGANPNYDREFANRFGQYDAKAHKNMREGAVIKVGNFIFVDQKMLSEIK